MLCDARKGVTGVETQLKSKKKNSGNCESKTKELPWISTPGRNSEVNNEETERDDRGREIITHATL